MPNELAPTRPSLALELHKAEPQIAAALPTGFPGGPERFIRIVLTASRLNPDLAKCSPLSIIGAAMQCAQLGLTPGALGEAWIIPYRNRAGGYEASFQIGWRGRVALADRAGIALTGDVVCEADDFDYESGTNPWLRHKPAAGDRGPSVYWYAIAKRKATDQLVSFAVLNRQQVDRYRRASRSPDSPAWRDWFDEMALGKAARVALRFTALTVEMATANASEELPRTRLEGGPEDLTEPPWLDADEPAPAEDANRFRVSSLAEDATAAASALEAEDGTE